MAGGNRPKSHVEPKAATAQMPASASGTSVAARHAHDRLVFLMANFVGCQAIVSLKSGDRFTGVFSAATLDAMDSRLVLKMAKRVPSPDGHQSNGVAPSSQSYLGHGEDHVLTFEMKDVHGIDVQQATIDKVQARLPNGSSFRTDTDISGNQEVKQRQLEAWQDTAGPATDMSLNGGSAAGWDQFATNQKLFGLKSDYDETMYTTAINRSSASYKDRVAQAERLAREIETSETSNPHVAEERNLISPEADGMDEEAKYSGVAREFDSLKSNNPNRYTPPARRAPTGQATVPGAPVDSAIISSSLARPSVGRTASPPKTDISVPSGKENAKLVPSASFETAAGSTTKDNRATTGQVSTAPQEAKEAESKIIAKPSSVAATSSRVSAATATGQPSVAPNMQNELFESIKQFSASERMKAIGKQREYQDRIRATKEKEREHKISDLKKFSANFKLNSPVPHDILGIMARDKEKQKEIERKTLQNLEDQRDTQKAPIVPSVPSESSPVPSAKNDRPTPNKNVRNTTGPSGQPPPGKSDKSTGHSVNGSSARIPGNLGTRLMQQQQLHAGRGFSNVHHHMAIPESRLQPLPPNSINTSVGSMRSSAAPTPNSALSNFNVQAMEFRPNPAAMSFQPSDSKSVSTSPARSRTKSNARKRQVNRIGLWAEGAKPEGSLKKSLNEMLNPFARLHLEAQQWVDSTGEEPREVKVKEVESNGGIRHAYRTPPRWPVSDRMSEKGWAQILEEALYVSQPLAASTYPIAHHMPVHIPGYFGPPRTPIQYRGPGHQGREYFDDHQRMQPGSTQSSVQPSPSMRHPTLANPQQMGYRLENGQMLYPVNGGQPMTPGRQYVGGQYVMPQGAPPMMMSHSQQGQYMGMQQPGQMPMYSPMPGQVYPVQGQQQGAYPSPRAAPLMVSQGSQHGQMPQQFMYQQQQSQGYPQHTQQMPMRGGVPMIQQGSFGSGQHAPHQGPHFRQQFAGGNFPQQQMVAGQMMPQQPIDR